MRKLGKRFMALVATAVLGATLLTGCGGSDSTTEKADDNKTTTEAGSTEATNTDGAPGVEGKTIGICIYKFDDNFMTLYRNELQSYLEAGGAKVTVMDGKNDQAEQTNQIQNFITQGVDALIVNLVQASAAEQIADQCAAANIPVVFINREPDATEEQRWIDEGIKATYVGADARQSGTFQGEIIAGLSDKGDINGDGEVGYVMVMGDPENVDAQYRTEFSIKALEDAGLTVKKLDEQRGDWDQAKGQEITANALTAYGDDIDVVFCNNDAMALGALQAIEAAGRKVGEDIYLVGVDALTDALENVKSGKITGTVFNDHIGQAHTAADITGKFLSDESVENVNMVDYVKVTTENAQEILDILK